MKPLVTSYRDLPAAALVNGVLQPAYAEASYAGTFFYCKSAPSAFRMAFDAGQFFDWDGGYKIANTPFRKIVFANDNLFPIRIYFSIGIESVDYIGTNDAKVAATFARGNLGYSYLLSVPKALNVDGGDWANNGGKQVDLNAPAPNQPLFVPGLFNGHRRKQITFYLAKESAADLVVFDENGGLFENLQKGVTAGSVRTYETSSDLYLLGSGDTAGGFFINEIYYAN